MVFWVYFLGPSCIIVRIIAVGPGPMSGYVNPRMLDASNAFMDDPGNAQFFESEQQMSGNVQSSGPPQHSPPSFLPWSSSDVSMFERPQQGQQDWDQQGPISMGVDNRIESFDSVRDAMGIDEEMYTTSSSSSRSSVLQQVASETPLFGPSMITPAPQPQSEQRPAAVGGFHHGWNNVQSLILRGMHREQHAKDRMEAIRDWIAEKTEGVKMAATNLSQRIARMKEKLVPRDGERAREAVEAAQTHLNAVLKEYGYAPEQVQDGDQQMKDVLNLAQLEFDSGIVTGLQNAVFILEASREFKANDLGSLEN
ncbi:hypothetical protein B0T20DRAFT_494240 [Sordaria brevicollis]|uniref:Uncharacterized protein n=1 Tax=Sordaria brevicollis TaxID=83679 RepID=A0AAE0PIG3_SORBR|nr:hypothetical protein B0T20DRAFT_494240 [Sordaria brevicollis]